MPNIITLHAFSGTPMAHPSRSCWILWPNAPFDITLDAITYKKSLTFIPIERSSFQAPEHSTPSPGLVGHTRLSPSCGIKSTKGLFMIKHVCANEQDGAVKEPFEGFFSFSVCYDSTYRKAGQGNSTKYKLTFWV
ncbi:hypothetical protein OG21DRAFT_1507698 [Imleria badia]|nr:hypothetical protein OG21DRAFT_1507698 [Imleria badia]